MFDNVALYVLLVVALGIGYLLGRREPLRRERPPGRVPEHYFTSFNQLINEQRDLDIDALVAAMERHDGDVDTRLALGSLVRRRGELDKAIRVHQGLLARPTLTPDQRSQIELELARDFMAAGLLGRAEELLLDLTRRDAPGRPTAERALLEIYQREREWQQAVAVGRRIARHDRTVNARLAHFQCELAERALADGELRLARQELARGAEFDRDCARLSLVGAELELEDGHPAEARRLLRRAVSQDADCVPLAVEPYRRACQALEDADGFAAFLEDCLSRGTHLTAVAALAEHIEQSCGPEAAFEFVLAQLSRNPTLGGVAALLERLDRAGQTLGGERVAQLRRLLQTLHGRQAVYRCRNCGFASRSLMWQCPSCHEWGACKPVAGGTVLP